MAECIIKAKAADGNFSPTGLRIAGRVTEVSINAATWTPLPSTALPDRNAISIQNYSGVEVKLNYDNTVATYTGVILSTNSERFYDITDSILIYAKSQAGTVTLIVEEIS